MIKNSSKLIAILFCSLVISSCSKKIDHEPVAAEASQEISVDAIATNDVSTENEPNITPVAEQKPDVILSTPVNESESARKMVREASVNFTAKDVVKVALAIDKMTFEAGGFVEQKNIHFQVMDVQTQKIADGKIKIFEKVDPIAVITVRIPTEKAAAYVNQLLPLMYFLNEQQYSAKRYELKLLEEKITQTQSVPGDTRNSQMSEISRLTKIEVQDRVRFSTINIYMTQPSTIRERMDVDVDAVARLNGDSFWKRSWNGIQYGWQFVLDVLVFLITIWPLYLLILLIYSVYRLIKPFLNKLK